MAYVGGEARRTQCVFCEALAGADDKATYVLHRGEGAFLILNAYPYAPGHLMAVLNRHVGDVTEASPAELQAAMGLVQRGVAALRAEYRAEGFNVGLNLGRVAGAGIADHLHVHVVPRWNGDSNFMPVLGDIRVLPESLAVTYERLKGHVDG
jgi:ATP adenylyltransferase